MPTPSAEFSPPVVPCSRRFLNPLLTSGRKRPLLGHQCFKVTATMGVVVAEHPRPFPFVGGTNNFSSQYERRAGVTRFLQVGKDSVAVPFMQEARNVLNEYPKGSEFSDDAELLEP